MADPGDRAKELVSATIPAALNNLIALRQNMPQIIHYCASIFPVSSVKITKEKKTIFVLRLFLDFVKGTKPLLSENLHQPNTRNCEMISPNFFMFPLAQCFFFP
jgi:hypothetical protein